MRDSGEWFLGDYAQRRWVRWLARRGNLLLPTHALQDNAPGTKAPMLLAEGGLLVAPDVLCIGAKATNWHEVKAKSAPNWHRNSARWEHGIDCANFEEYAEIQARTGWRVEMVLHEEQSPTDEQACSALLPSDVWLWAPLDAVRDAGEHRPAWPGGAADPTRRGRRGKGGWLWPRAVMRRIDVDAEPQVGMF